MSIDGGEDLVKPHESLKNPENINRTFGNGGAPNVNPKIHKPFYYGLIFTIVLGMFNMGYSVGSWNSTNEVYARTMGWDRETML